LPNLNGLSRQADNALNERLCGVKRVRIAVYPVHEWFDDLGVYHDLILTGSDVNWLSEMGVSIKTETPKIDLPSIH
jgi:hypothetical protein